MDMETDIKYVCNKYPWLDYQLYRKIMIFCIVIFSSFFFICGTIYFNDAYTGLLISAISAIAILFLFKIYPYLLKKAFVGQIERELPFFLMDLDLRLKLGSNFFDALQKSSAPYFMIKQIVTKILQRYDKGVALTTSFLEISADIDSSDLKRSLQQIGAIYASGYKTDTNLQDFAKELLDKQQSESKVYYNKLVFISLLFIGATALLPALLLIFVAIGGSIIDIGLTEMEIYVLFLVIFPVIDLVIIFVAQNIMPGHIK